MWFMAHKLFIVAGMHRSGTSLFARMLEVYGIRLPGELVGPAEDNQKGFFEDRAIIKLNDELLRVLDLRWDSMHGFFLDKASFSHPKFNHLKKQANDLLGERVALDTDWAFKDPRISRLTGFWLPLLQSAEIPYKFVIAIRNPAEVAGSLAARNDIDPLKSQYLWLLYNLDVLGATEPANRIIIHHEDVMSDPKALVQQHESFFGLANVEAIASFSNDFVAAELHHNQARRLHTEVDLTWVLYNSLKQDSPEQIQKIRGLIEQQDSVQQLLSYASVFEIKAEEAKLTEYEELTSVISRQRLDLKASDSRLEKLSVDIELLHGSVAKKDELVVAHVAHIEELVEGNRRISEEFAQESKRLWDIIEKYRLQSEEFALESRDIAEKCRLQIGALESSLSWKLTAPLRLVRRVVQRAPGYIGRKTIGLLKRLIYRLPIHRAPGYIGRKTIGLLKRLIYRLPLENRFRQLSIKLYERSLLIWRGEIDNRSIRASHHAIISSRKQLLGAKPLLKELPLIDISVVTYNSEKWVDGFFTSLCAQDYPLNKLAIVFVDNGSKDATVSTLKQLDWSQFAKVDFIESSNLGYGAGHNQAIAQGENEFVLITNIDLQFRTSSLVRCVSFACQDKAAIASWEFRQAPYEHPKFYDPVSLQTAWSSHACILMRREVLDLVGGYEEKIFMYGEDVELSYRFRAAGYCLRYLPSAVVDHYTYEEPGEVKLLQYQGSTLANAYIRLRYGSWLDVARIFILYSRLAAGNAGIENNRQIVRKNIGSILRNGLHFLSKRRGAQAFSFRDWDYDIVRAGAFYEAPDLAPDLAGDIPLVSVITRTYEGRESLLRECMQSVAHQTYGNTEHVIVEDGGTTMAATIEEFKKAYPDALISYNPLDKVGRCHAGNLGMEVSTGKFLVFLDDDDLFFCDHLEVCLGELQSDSRYAAVYALAWEVETEFDADADADGYEEMSHGTADIFHQEFDRNVLAYHNFIPIQSIVFQRKLFEEYGGFDPELDNLEDWNLWIRYSGNAEFKLISKTTSMYRTPWDMEERAKRQGVLDAYLDVAIAKNAAVIGE